MRIGLVIEYDGTMLHGSQLQAGVRTVQGEIEAALAALFGGHIRVHLASRTDAGVHATGQVGRFDVETDLSGDKIRDALNHHLPRDVAVVCAGRVADDFDARGGAISREYRYTIYDRPARSPYREGRALHVHRRLDDRAMASAARLLEGSHDFAAFAGPQTPGDAVTVRRICSASVTRDGDTVELRFVGNAFFNQQVRRMVGELLRVGRGAMDEATFKQLIDRGVRGMARRPAPPGGLCLTKVNYPGADESGLPRTD